MNETHLFLSFISTAYAVLLLTLDTQSVPTTRTTPQLDGHSLRTNDDGVQDDASSNHHIEPLLGLGAGEAGGSGILKRRKVAHQTDTCWKLEHKRN